MKQITHSVQIPPLTDVEQLLGCYRALFDMLGLPNSMPFPLGSGFTHPVEAENTKLMTAFYNTKIVVEQLMRDRISVKLADCRVNQIMVTFIFSYQES